MPKPAIQVHPAGIPVMIQRPMRAAPAWWADCAGSAVIVNFDRTGLRLCPGKCTRQFAPSNCSGGLAHLPCRVDDHLLFLLELGGEFFAGKIQWIAVHVAGQKAGLQGVGQQGVLIADGMVGERGLGGEEAGLQDRQKLLLPERGLGRVAGGDGLMRGVDEIGNGGEIMVGQRLRNYLRENGRLRHRTVSLSLIPALARQSSGWPAWRRFRLRCRPALPAAFPDSRPVAPARQPAGPVAGPAAPFAEPVGRPGKPSAAPAAPPAAPAVAPDSEPAEQRTSPPPRPDSAAAAPVVRRPERPEPAAEPAALPDRLAA